MPVNYPILSYPPFTETQLRRIWELQPSEFRLRLPHAFSKLSASDPPPPEDFLTEWTSYLRGRIRHECQTTQTPICRLCIEAGIVPTLMKISELQGSRYRYAKPYALEALGDLARAGDSEQNRTLAKQVQEGGGLVTLLKPFKSEFFTQRAAAVRSIHFLCNDACFAELCSPEDLADLMHDVLTYALRGHEPILEELDDPDKFYQKDFMMQPTVSTARIYAPRWFGMSEEHACWTAHSSLCRERGPSRRECLAIIERRPEILDLLLKIALRRRTEWYPESVVDAVSMETLQLLLMTPYGIVPGLPGAGGGEATSNEDEGLRQEWEATVRCWNIFVTTERWRERLLAVWRKVEREEYRHIEEKFAMTDHYLAQISPDTESFTEAVQSRGFLRICVLRIMIYMTYLPPSVIPLPIFLSFLATAYKACQKLPTAVERPGDFTDGQELFTTEERLVELCRTSVSVSGLGITIPVCLMVAPETILGPTLVMRILFHVISEGLVHSLSAIAQWKELPTGTPLDTALPQVCQIASLSVLGIIVRAALAKRVKERRESGHPRRREEDFAVAAYVSAAELAVAARALNQAVNGEERKAWEKEAKHIQQEIVLCLGGAADAWAELDEWELSRWTSQKAVECLEGIDATQAKREGWDALKLRVKNSNRLKKARYVLHPTN